MKPIELPAIVDGARAACKNDLEVIGYLAGEISRLRSLPGETSDGYHTFNELYEHRCTLFLALMKAHPTLSWISTKHHDGSEWDGWFIAGIKAPTGDLTYHLPVGMWSLACETGAAALETGMFWDGHTPAQVVERIKAWIALPRS